MALWKPIPGETPIDDISGLKIKGITLRRELNEAEAQNNLQAAIKYFAGALSGQTAPFTLSWALQLHREMFGDVWQWAGVLRTVDLNLGVPWQHVETRLYDLLVNLKYWANTPLVEQAALLHHQAVAIHPFLNGNGRWARMLANIWLKLQGGEPTAWPETTVGETSPVRADYLNAIRAADQGDYAALIELHRRFTAST